MTAKENYNHETGQRGRNFGLPFDQLMWSTREYQNDLLTEGRLCKTKKCSPGESLTNITNFLDLVLFGFHFARMTMRLFNFRGGQNKRLTHAFLLDVTWHGIELELDGLGDKRT